MKNNILYLMSLLFFSTVPAFADKKNNGCTADLIKKEIKSYIEYQKEKTVSDGAFNVYLISFYNIGSTEQPLLGFSMEVVYNSCDFKYLQTTDYVDFDNEYVFVKIKDSSIMPLLTALPIKKVSSNTRVKAAQKTYPSVVGFISHSGAGLSGKIENCSVTKKMYTEDDMPTELRVLEIPDLSNREIKKN